MGLKYCTVEDVKTALDVKLAARSDSQIYSAIEAASRHIERQLHRKFYPKVDTRYFDWPNRQMGNVYRLWLDENELLSVSAISSGGNAISASDYWLEPANDGPPYDHIELDRSSTATFGRGSTPQRDIVITGVFGFCNETEAAGTAVEALDASETGVDISDASLIGVGDTLLIDSEYMLVVGRNWLTTGQTLQTPLTAQSNGNTVAVTTGSEYHAGEIILLDSERMLVNDVAGNNLSVTRAWDGTTLAAHTGSTIYAQRTLTVARGSLGTTAATHLINAPIAKHIVPGPIREYAVAEACNTLLQRSSGYSRVLGQAEKGSGAALADVRAAAYSEYGRKGRLGVV